MNPVRILKQFFLWCLHHKKRSALLLVVLLILGFFLRPKPPKQIATEPVKFGTITESLSVSGSLVSEHQVDMNFLGAGKLVYLPIAKGDHVKAGQVIAQQDIRATEKNLQTALRNYSEQRNTFDQTKDNYQSATPDTALNDQARRILQNNQYDLDKAVISVELQDLAKQNALLVSPIDGYITRLDASAAGTNVTAATVFEITDLDHLTFDMDVDESDIGKVTTGLPVRITLDSFPNQVLTYQVDAIDYAAHTTSTGGTAYTVTVKFPASGAIQYRTGMSGDADIILDERKHVLKIPVSSLVDDTYVYVQSGRMFEKRKVNLGLQSDLDTEVKSGLSEGDNVAVQPSNIPANMIKK
jgi:HlyD family secretion protein